MPIAATRSFVVRKSGIDAAFTLRYRRSLSARCLGNGPFGKRAGRHKPRVTASDSLYDPSRWGPMRSSSVPNLRQRRSAMKVKDAMHKRSRWVNPDTPVMRLAKLMREHDISAIPVGENDQLVGIVTDRDIVCKGLAQNGFDPSRAHGARRDDCGRIHCCREDDDLAKAVQHMESLKIRRLPVINKNKRMVGMLALGDVSTAAPGDLVSQCVKSVSAHH